MALKKETQTILGIGTASIITYLYLKKNKNKFSSFVQSDYDACVAQGNSPESCCAKFEGVFTNGVCGQVIPPDDPCPGGTIINGLCVDTTGTTDTNTDTDTDTDTGTDTDTESDTGSGTSTDTTTTAATNTGNSTTTINIPSNPIIFPVPVFSSNAVSSGDGFSPSSSSAAAATADEFDWIPIILGGITIALSIISEK
jgi:hypothetical protein